MKSSRSRCLIFVSESRNYERDSSNGGHSRAFSEVQRPVKYGRNFVKSPEGSYKVVHLYIHASGRIGEIDSIDRLATGGWNWCSRWRWSPGSSSPPLKPRQPASAAKRRIFWLVNSAVLCEKYGGNGVLPLRGSARYTVPFLPVNPVRKNRVVNSFPMLARLRCCCCRYYSSVFL